MANKFWKAKVSLKHKQSPAKIATKALLSLLKPTLTALAFLLVSSWSQHFMDKIEMPTGCWGRVGTMVGGSVASLSELENKQVMVGARALVITRHAAQRMIERGVTVEHIQRAVKLGRLFAYQHGGLIKIGYYDQARKVFLAVDRKHEKIITAIRNSPRDYFLRLYQGDAYIVRSIKANK